uniref:G_PROTEIN_RECEP_F1_2 domain-containing protein n=1 Tax=Caenorhabditis tropicalis TaxID=1561998 RepID=A0A1I7UMX0_9PELO
MHLPLLSTYSAALLWEFTNVGIGRLSNFASITIALYPVIDPLPTIFIIKNYREGLKQFCLKPIKYCIEFKNRESANTAQKDDASSRRISNKPEEDNVSIWGDVL